MQRNILIALKIRLEELLDHPRLHRLALCLAQLDDPVRVPRIARLAAVGKVDADLLSDLGEADLHHARALGAELLLVEGLLVDGDFGGVRVQVEGRPGCGEGVGRVRLLVLGYGQVEAVLAHVAPGAHGIADDLNVVVGHFAEGGAESQGGWW